MKSVIDIDINDEEFKEFSGLFDKHLEKLKKLPGAWGGVNKEMKSSFEAATAALLAQSELNRRIVNEQKDQENSAHSIANWWGDTASSAGKFAGKISDVTKDLIKWTGITAAITGLLGFGGVWGLDRLAGTVGYNRRINQGLGISQGERAAFNLNYGRILNDPQSFLTDINSSLYDPSQRYRLFAAGAANQNTTSGAALAVLDEYRRIAQTTPKSNWGSILRARGNFMSLQEMETLGSLSNEEYSSIRKNYGQDKSTLAQKDPMMRSWQEFNIQLSRAGSQIEAAFVTGLTPLIPQLERFSKVISDMVLKFMTWVDKSGAIDAVADGLKSVGDWLEDPENRKRIKDDLILLGNDISAAAKWVHDALHKAGVVKDSFEEGEKKAGLAGGILGSAQAIKKGLVTDSAEVFGPWAGLLPAIAKVESNNNPVAVSSKGALGMYQMRLDVAKQYGVDNPFNPQQEAHGAALYLGDLAKKYNNDVTRMLAAYNWGPANLDRDISKYGADWFKHLPKETSQYVEKVLHDRSAFMTAARAPGADTTAIKLEIYNFTGSDIVATAGQIAK